ncbi:hypothetical protein ACFO25_04735 [Paenactinomyces guangxiensis]|uniref:Type II toxin-antitoxin system RelE/ParE family toxin n=1 Tax=Paenactinomyces guangxiensis TaxID=1490290 RepID=A0A7W2A813_9BACL|nr:hypothetical protein [Paenactinomyces guangxiensis]MBA4493684.1 hypothetical protein [Paenactinomyces guangxiensis]MBH8590971.1 hypothetical protein [Paenactinomyces guangxiensis]
MIQEVYHPMFTDDLDFLAQKLGKRKFNECLIQIDQAIEQVLRNPYKAAALKHPPLQAYRKKKFFSAPRPHKKKRPNMRLLYRYVPGENTVYFLAVGFRMATKHRNPHDIYQRAKKREFSQWEPKDDENEKNTE